MKKMILAIVLLAGTGAGATEVCESRAKVLESYLANPLLQLETAKPEWKYYAPLLKGVSFKQEADQKITVKYQDQSLSGNKLCIDFKNHKIYVVGNAGGTDAANLLPRATPAQAQAPVDRRGSAVGRAPASPQGALVAQ